MTTSSPDIGAASVVAGAAVRRRRWLAAALLAPFVPAHGARTPPQRAMPLVGVLASTGLTPLDYLRQGLAGLGYTEGQNISFAFRSADGNPRDLPGLARHMARLEVNVLFCSGPAALDAAAHATSRVPIVALDLETDPVRSGLVKSLAHPRTNVTGVFLDQPTLANKWLQLMRQALPQAKQLNVLWDASSGPWQLAAAKAAAKKRGFEVDILSVRNEGEFERELNDGLASKPDALLLLSSPLVRARSAQIAEFTQRHRLPALSAFAEFTRAGGLMSYGPEVQNYYVRAAGFVDKVLKGSRAGDLPISVPGDLKLVANLRAAADLGLTLPPALTSVAQELVR